jgi:hypothetical protein
MQLLLERAVANLLQDICVPRLVDFECLDAVEADDFMHVHAPTDRLTTLFAFLLSAP